MKDKLDIGAIDVSARKQATIELRILLERNGFRYMVDVNENNVVRLFNMSAAREITPITHAEDRALIGYALRRAICRGIDTTEIEENELRVTLRLGVVP